MSMGGFCPGFDGSWTCVTGLSWFPVAAMSVVSGLAGSGTGRSPAA